MILRTLKFRIKDSASRKVLKEMSHSVNFVWNYCNEVNQERWKKFRKTFTGFELNNLTAGCAKDLGLHSATVNAVAEQFAKSCKQAKRIRLSWRSRKRSLGWIPFKSSGIKIDGSFVKYSGHTFKLWLSQPIDKHVRFGSFTEDSSGRWFLNVVIEAQADVRFNTGLEVGIDLGLNTLATLSNGIEFARPNITHTYENRLAKSQKANKKNRIKSIHTKIKNVRKDWNHKVSTLLTRQYDKIFVGDVCSSKLKKTKLAKSVSDAAWYDFKRILEYKAIGLGVEYREVNENFSTVTCSHCGSRTGPRGQAGLKVREWMCSSCGITHNRDVNAATNILLSAQGIVRH